MKGTTSIYISDKDKRKGEYLMNVYETEKFSELIRILIEKEYNQVRQYQELNIQTK